MEIERREIKIKGVYKDSEERERYRAGGEKECVWVNERWIEGIIFCIRL